MTSALTQPLNQLARRWRDITRPSRWRASAAAAALSLVVAPLGARAGSPPAKAAAWLVLALTVLATLAWALFDRQRVRDPRRLLAGAVGFADRQRADRAVRALSFLAADGQVSVDGVSAILAQAHVVRTLADLPADRIIERTRRSASRIALVASVVGFAVLIVGSTRAWSVLEGCDVLLARDGQAPLSMQWLESVEAVVRPPEYLHDGGFSSFGLQPLFVPYGSVIAVTGMPVHTGRHLLLSDGHTEVEFVDDGSGGLVARWSASGNATLRVVARFGGVVISEAQGISMTSLPDAAPAVSLEGAPRRLVLLEATEDVPIRYEAADDHGLREVDLVLRSGSREERRVLARLDGETKTDRGGLMLKLRDPFVSKSHAPVEVTVEAKDNDPLTGPKWGASAAITLVPPAIGEAEVLRADALRKLRDTLVDTLAWRLEREAPIDAPARRLFAVEDRTRSDEDARIAADALSTVHAGVRVPPRVHALVAAKRRQLDKVLDAEARDPTDAARASVVRATERFALVADALVRGLALHDARDVGRRLADVADDLALGARQLQDEAARDGARGAARVGASLQMLADGSPTLGKLGSLGHDLAETIEADLLRFHRAFDARDLVHAELVARDLAARLHQPDPAFGSSSAPSRAAGESGRAGDTAAGDDDESGDEVDQAFEAARQDLERLAQEHAGKMAALQQALDAAAGTQEPQNALEEDARRAQAIRDAIRELPRVGSGSDSWTSKGSSARELGEQMAQSLAAGRHAEAGRTGRDAVAALDEADKMIERGGWFSDPGQRGKRAVARARTELRAESEWADEQASKATRQTAERAGNQVQQAAGDEGDMAERAAELGHKSRESGALPDEATDAIDEASREAREAADALKHGDVERGVDRQRAVQRDLEAASERLGDDSEGSSAQDGTSESSKRAGGPVDIPTQDKATPSQEDLRRRILHGLTSGANGAWRDAVERYARGLLR